MTTATKVKANWKEDKENLQIEISSMRKSMDDFKIERKTEWKTFKNKFNDDLDKVEKLLKGLTAFHKK